MNFINNYIDIAHKNFKISEDLKVKVVLDLEFPKLPYSFNALEPVIDATTMKIHHGKHHKKYYDTMMELLQDNSKFKNKSLIEVLQNLDLAKKEDKDKLSNNAGGHFNHSFFWQIMSEEVNQKPSGALLEDIEKEFKSFENFKKEFIEVGIKHFGSGWVWMCVNEGKLKVQGFANQSNPYIEGCGIPVLGCDVWEHAYYLKYQNNREKYITNWFKIINWELVSEYYKGIR